MQEEYDTHDPKGHNLSSLPFLKKRSKIIEIVAARDIVFALAQSGVCAAFSRGGLFCRREILYFILCIFFLLTLLCYLQKQTRGYVF